MRYDTLEREIYSAWHKRDFAGMYQRVNLYLTRWHGIERGRGLGLAAILLYADDFRNLTRALAMTAEALPYVSGDPESAAKCLINGLMYSRMASADDLLASYARSLDLIASLHAAAVSPWQGRILVALGQYAEHLGDLTAASAYYARAVAFHRSNIGPHAGLECAEQDQRCYRAISAAGSTRIHIRQGHLDLAELLVKQVRAARLPEEHNPHAHYLTALIAVERGDLPGAKKSLDTLLTDPRIRSTHELRFLGSELLARCYAEMGRQDEVHQVLGQCMADLQATGNVRGLLRMQRYIQHLRSKSA